MKVSAQSKSSGGGGSWLALLFTALWLGGCASVPVPQTQRTAPAEQIDRPGRFLVYDFAATRQTLPPDSLILAHAASDAPPQGAEEIALGERTGRLVAERIVERLRAQQLEAYLVAYGPTPGMGDVVVRGEFVAIDPGSRTLRVLIGFGAGRGELSAMVEAFQIGPQGPRTIGFAQSRTTGGRLPGMALPLGVAGNLAASAAVSGASNTLQERGPENIRAAALRTGDAIADAIVGAYRARDW